MIFSTRRFRIAHHAAVCAAILGTGALAASAEHTRYWVQSSYDDFTKGSPNGVALRSDGKLMLAPQFSLMADPGMAFLWAIRADAKGNLFAAGGSSAKVLKYDATGKISTVFESNELAAQSLAVDAQGSLYVGTSPDGKVYKVWPTGEKKVFFEPHTKYIWDLEIDTDGTLYVATGDNGQIFAVAPDGKSELFYKSDQANLRVLAFDGHGNLLAGTEPDGRILRVPKVPPQGQARHAFVLYETPNQEITSLLVDRAGNIFASSIGDKFRNAAPLPAPAPAAQPQSSQGTMVSGTTVTMSFDAGPNPQSLPPASSAPPSNAVSGSAVYKLSTDGSPEELWSSRDVLVYSLGMDASGRLLLGTGNKGAIIQLEPNRVFSNLEKTETAQVTGLVQRPGGGVFVCTANPAKVFSMGPDEAAQGSFESAPLDARFFSQWGRLEWWSQTTVEHDSPRVEFYARAGNTSIPDENWSAWAGPFTASGQEMKLPAARYAQWKAVLRRGSSPLVAWVSLAYLPKNVAPEVTDIAVQDPGVRVQGAPQIVSSDRIAPPAHVRMPQSTGQSSNGFGYGNQPASSSSRFDLPPQGVMQKGYESVVWTAQDANDDDLTYRIYYRGEREVEWKLLKDDLHEKFFAWDTTSMPDGAYYLKIVASDAPSNPPAEALTGSLESERFVVDNTPPVVSAMTAAASESSANLKFAARDSASPISRAEYSVDAGEWKLVEPVGRISDSADESYDFAVKPLGNGEHTVAVRVYDRFENVGSNKVTFRVGPAPAAAPAH
ncbi:MAG TPA: hypothetical protein VFO34_15510 [Candidatus Acidoferrales bacterium]|nr:hypothetical protein [Candidatus Acidoferrales bacterium]